LIREKHPLPAFAIADFFLRPQPSNNISLDPRIPPYIQVLTRLGYVDSTSILKALYKYSTSREQLQAQKSSDSGRARSGQAASGETEKDGSTDEGNGQKNVYWKNSYWAEEVLFYHVIKIVVESPGFRDSHAVLDMVMIASRWMELFTAAAGAFAAEMLDPKQDTQARHHEMEMSRAAFVPLLLRLFDSPDVSRVLHKREARG
jgi:mediator of RNA polymerase II transcription subunit 5